MKREWPISIAASLLCHGVVLTGLHQAWVQMRQRERVEPITLVLRTIDAVPTTPATEIAQRGLTPAGAIEPPNDPPPSEIKFPSEPEVGATSNQRANQFDPPFKSSEVAVENLVTATAPPKAESAIAKVEVGHIELTPSQPTISTPLADVRPLLEIQSISTAVSEQSSTATGSLVDRNPPSGSAANEVTRPALRTAILTSPSYLRTTQPRYPTAALRRRQEGSVLLRVTVAADGHPSRLSIQHSSGYPVLDQAAVQAVSEWVFEPARLDAKPVQSEIEVPVRFRLED